MLIQFDFFIIYSGYNDIAKRIVFKDYLGNEHEGEYLRRNKLVQFLLDHSFAALSISEKIAIMKYKDVNRAHFKECDALFTAHSFKDRMDACINLAEKHKKGILVIIQPEPYQFRKLYNNESIKNVILCHKMIKEAMGVWGVKQREIFWIYQRYF